MEMQMPRTVSEAYEVFGLPPGGPAYVSVRKAGMLTYGLSHSQSYKAAQDQALPVETVNGRLKVPIIALARKVLAAGNDRSEAS